MNSKNDIKENKIKIKYEMGEDIIIEDGFMRVARSPHKLKLPQRLDNDLAYLAGYHLGDGYLMDIRKMFRKRGKGDYEIDYADGDIKQLKLINAIIKDKFDFELRIYKRPTANLWIARKDCKVLHWFLNKKLGMPTGERKIIKIPDWVFTNKEFLSNFLSGFFDAESDVGKITNGSYKGKKYYRIRVQLTQKDYNILSEIKSVLEKYFYIKSDINKKWNQDAFILRIIARNAINIFKEKINFRNSNKKGKLNQLINQIPYKQPRKIR